MISYESGTRDASDESRMIGSPNNLLSTQNLILNRHAADELLVFSLSTRLLFAALLQDSFDIVHVISYTIITVISLVSQILKQQPACCPTSQTANVMYGRRCFGVSNSTLQNSLPMPGYVRDFKLTLDVFRCYLKSYLYLPSD